VSSISDKSAVNEGQYSSQKGAWGPARQTFIVASPATYVTFNSIVDNPTYGDERDFLHVKPVEESSSKYVSSIKLIPEMTYKILVFYHNNASKSRNGVHFDGVGVAEGAYVRAEFPSYVRKDKVCYANVYLGAQNANPRYVFNSIVFTSDSTVTLRYVPNSAKLHNFVNDNPSDSTIREFALSPEQLFGEGAPIGFDSMNGRLPGCNEYAGFITFQMLAVPGGA
jgi:hypothetical protein